MAHLLYHSGTMENPPSFAPDVSDSFSGNVLGRWDLSEVCHLLDSNLEIRHRSPCS